MSGPVHLLPQIPTTPPKPNVHIGPERDAVLLDLLGLRIEAWFREARQRVAAWEPAPCPTVRPCYWKGGA